MDQLIRKVNNGDLLNHKEACQLFEAMVSGTLTEAQIAAALIAMKFRKETVDELAALVEILNEHKKKFGKTTENSIDTCGTGGDGKSTVNISTAVSVILASLGHSVVKHGNTAQSGIVGSADILSEMGMDLSYSGSSPEEFFDRHNFVFMLAPQYHPALKGIGKVRREIKVATIFNFVGPLVNPADPTYQVIGINRKEKMEFIAEVIIKLKKNNITVYSSQDGYDEVSSRGKTECITIKDGSKESFIIDPSDYFEPFDMPVVKDKNDAKNLFINGLTGKDTAIASIFSLNAALALKTMKKAELKDGYEQIREHIQSGHVKNKLDELVG